MPTMGAATARAMLTDAVRLRTTPKTPKGGDGSASVAMSRAGAPDFSSASATSNPNKAANGVCSTSKTGTAAAARAPRKSSITPPTIKAVCTNTAAPMATGSP